MVAPSRFCHVVYRTQRFEEMVAWYQRVFEAKVQIRTDRYAFLTYDDEHHRFAILNVAAPPEGLDAPQSYSRVAHVAYAWENLDGLLDTYKRLKADGVLPVRPTRHGITLSIYYQDPDGNGLEFQVDLLDEEASNDYMTSPEFIANPSGDRFDPDELVQRYETGAPVDDLIFRPEQPERMGSRYVRGRPQPPAGLHGGVGKIRVNGPKSTVAKPD